MNYIHITQENIDQEHICCALGAKSYETAVLEKKQWLRQRMDDGLVFYRLNERAKVFIEYMPAEQAWVPIHAPNYMFIQCLWVSGRYKGQGHSRHLLDRCISDAKERGMEGIVHIVGKKKLPYLSDPQFWTHMGFTIMDQAEPYFQLAVLQFSDQAVRPSFKPNVKVPLNEQGIVIYYTPQCPFAVGMIDSLKCIADSFGVRFHAYKLTSCDEAQQAPTVWTTFGLFYDGQFITHEIMSVGKFENLLRTLTIHPS